MGTTPDRVKATSTTSSTGSLTLIDPPAGLRSPTAHFGSGTTRLGYQIAGPSGLAPTYHERGFGDFNGTTKVLTRASVVRSSNSDALVNLPAGTHDVFMFWPVGAIGSRQVAVSTTVGLDDWGDMLEFTGAAAATWTLQAVANVPDGYSFGVNHIGTGASVLTISGATIDGAASISVFPGESFWIKKLGASNYRTIGRARGWIPLETLTAALSATLDFTKFIEGSHFPSFALVLDALVPSAGDTTFALRVGIGATPTWQTGGAQYARTARIQVSTGAGTEQFFSAAGEIALTQSTSPHAVAFNAQFSGTILFADPAVQPIPDFDISTVYHKPALDLVSYKGAGSFVSGQTPITGLRIFPSAGTIESGTATLFGIRR